MKNNIKVITYIIFMIVLFYFAFKISIESFFDVHMVK